MEKKCKKCNKTFKRIEFINGKFVDLGNTRVHCLICMPYKKDRINRICKQCKSTMPASLIINGSRRILSSRKFCLKCSPYGKHNTRDLTKPKKIKTKYTYPWNKGLTKETDKKLKKISDKLKGMHKKQNNPWSNIKPKPGRPHTEETKEKISKARIKFLEKNPDKIPYILNHASTKSKPEEYFKKLLIENKIDGWKQRYQRGLYQYDFAFLKIKLDVEIDGELHNTEKVKKIEKRRDKWSKSLGWKVLRITTKELYETPDNSIKKLKSILG